MKYYIYLYIVVKVNEPRLFNKKSRNLVTEWVIKIIKIRNIITRLRS